jgi:hypothetical protein
MTSKRSYETCWAKVYVYLLYPIRVQPNFRGSLTPKAHTFPEVVIVRYRPAKTDV